MNMVTSTAQSGVSAAPAANLPNDVIANGGIPMNQLPVGKYTIVGIDIDTTGRRLIDEIVQLAAYTPIDHFEQYIMPYMNLNPAARQRHQVRVISIGFYRMLKSMQTYKIIKSKSEIAAMKDFLDWLEAIKAKDVNSKGIILVYHEERKFIPYMILESLKKYNLLDRFLSSVKAFANGLNLAKANVNESLQHYTLRKLSKVLGAKPIGDGNSAGDTAITRNPQQNDIFDGNASVRARLAYEVAFLLSNQECKDKMDPICAADRFLDAVYPYAQPIEKDLNELETQNQNLERQNSFRPVFLNYFKTTLYHRVRAVKFRIILAEQGYDLSSLNEIWNEKKRDGLYDVLQGINELKPDDKLELADLFDSYFDPSKTMIKPIVKANNNNRRRNRRGGMRNGNYKNEGNNSARANTEQGAGGDKQGISGPLPDSTTKSPTQNNNNNTINTNNNQICGNGGGNKPQRSRRNPRSRNNALKNQGPGVNMANNVPVVAANC